MFDLIPPLVNRGQLLILKQAGTFKKQVIKPITIVMENVAKPVEMIGIPIQEFISASKLPVDIFIRMVSGRYIQVAKSGDTVDLGRLRNYESKHVDKLYVRKVDYSSYVDQNLVIAGITVTRADLDSRTKANFITQVAVSVNQEMDDLGLTVETYQHAKNITRVAIDLAESKIGFKDLLESLNGSSSEVLAHSLGVSIVSVMIGQQLGWGQAVILEKLALGGLLHDLGLKELPRDLVFKQPEERSFEELREYETHVSRGVEMVRVLGLVPEDVIAIIQEHHEVANGQGYPRRLKNIRIHPLARVVGIADAFCDIAVKSPTSRRLKPAAEAFRVLEKTNSQLFSKEVLDALRDVLRSDVSLKKIA
jgi:putative nucleotidyltransferase with HDIG domain